MTKASSNLEFLLIIPSISLFCLVNEKLISGNKSEGQSMEPTITHSSFLIVDKFFFKFRGIKRGDIVISKSPVDPKVDICKRVVHLEKERVHGIEIPKNHVWLEGDNKNNSYDSRNHGPVPIGLVKARVVSSLYPLKSFY
jgi:inner membrane protease subunit 1